MCALYIYFPLYVQVYVNLRVNVQLSTSLSTLYNIGLTLICNVCALNKIRNILLQQNITTP